MLILDDTIAAIATALHPSPRGIIRVSGPDLIPVLQRVLATSQPLETVRHPSVLDCELVLDDAGRHLPGRLYVWPSRQSYTRQPTAEVHTVGCPPLLERILANLRQAGARLAEPGEFTLRAFLGGRIDLAKAEAVLGAIDADSDQAFEVAIAQMAGGLSTKIDGLRDELLNLCADLEAGLDFVDEDLQFVSFDELTTRLASVATAIDRLLSQVEGRGAAPGVARVVICGSPNAGKSTLFNALGAPSGALTSAEPGTTRDYLIKSTTLDGHPIELVDTAGLAVSAVSAIDELAQTRTRELIDTGQLILVCLDRSRPPAEYDEQLLRETASTPRMIVLTKSDLPSAWAPSETCDALSICALDEDGLGPLRSRIAQFLRQAKPVDMVHSTAARTTESLRLTQACLERAHELAAGQESEELIAAELRVALDALGTVVGAIYTDDLLDRVFSRFCIGK